MDNPQNAEEMRNILLLTLYRLATRGTKSHIDVYDLERESNIGDEFKPALDFLRQKQFLVKRNLKIQITASGMEKAERIMAETYRSKERRALQKLYDERDRRYTNPHQPDELARELNLDLREAQDIVVELERKGLTDGNDQATWIIAAGLEEIESGGQRQGPPQALALPPTFTDRTMAGYNRAVREILRTSHSPIPTMPILIGRLRA
jgi:hypothetical protein